MSGHYVSLVLFFTTDFSEFVYQYVTAPGDLLISGDFNLYHAQPDSADVSRFGILPCDNKLRQVISEPTHRKGHTSDWQMVHLAAPYVSWTDDAPIRSFPCLPFPSRPMPNRLVPILPDGNIDAISPGFVSPRTRQLVS